MMMMDDDNGDDYDDDDDDYIWDDDDDDDDDNDWHLWPYRLPLVAVVVQRGNNTVLHVASRPRTGTSLLLLLRLQGKEKAINGLSCLAPRAAVSTDSLCPGQCRNISPSHLNWCI